MAVSVCLTPAAPAPLPIPYPTVAMVTDGISDSPLRTKVSGTNCATIGSVLKVCHGNEPGTLKEVVSLNNTGPRAPLTGAFTVLIELGPAAITGSLVDMNKAPTPGAGSSGSDAGGAGGGGGGGAGAPGAGGGPSGPSGPSGGRWGQRGSSTAAGGPNAPSAHERAIAAAPGDTPEQRAARKKVAEDFYEKNCPGMSRPDIDSHVRCADPSKPVSIVQIPPSGGGPNGDQLYQHTFPGKTGQYFANDPATTPDQLGTNPRVLVPGSGDTPPHIVPRDPQSYSCDPNNPTTGLQSTAAPANDTWSQSGQPYQAPGGGNQIMVPRGNQGGVSQN